MSKLFANMIARSTLWGHNMSELCLQLVATPEWPKTINTALTLRDTQLFLYYINYSANLMFQNLNLLQQDHVDVVWSDLIDSGLAIWANNPTVIITFNSYMLFIFHAFKVWSGSIFSRAKNPLIKSIKFWSSPSRSYPLCHLYHTSHTFFSLRSAPSWPPRIYLHVPRITRMCITGCPKLFSIFFLAC